MERTSPLKKNLPASLRRLLGGGGARSIGTLGVTTLTATMIAMAPPVQADPCVDYPGKAAAQWFDPCTAYAPPWNGPNWSYTPTPGQWGPNGYQPNYNS